MYTTITRAGYAFNRKNAIVSDKPKSMDFKQGVYYIHLSDAAAYLNDFGIRFTHKKSGESFMAEKNVRVLGFPKWVRSKKALLVFIPKDGSYEVRCINSQSLKVYYGLAVGFIFWIPLLRSKQVNLIFEPDWK